MRSKSFGFTIVELIIVVGMISIFSGLMLPSFLNWIRSEQINSYTRELREYLRVVRLDARRWGSICNVNTNFTDINNNADLKKIVSNNFEYVINLSGYINHEKYFDSTSDLIDTHFNGVKNIVKNLNRSNLIKFVQIGSSDEYGENLSPLNEDLPAAPISPYAFSKYASIELLKMLHKTESFPSVMLRLFLVFGPRQDSNRFLPQLIKGCLEDKKIPVSSGEQLRDFCYVENIVEGIMLSLSCEDAVGEIINLGSGKPISIKQMINRVHSKIGSGKPVFGQIAHRPQENIELYADVTKAKELLGWEERISLEECLDRTINHYRN